MVRLVALLGVATASLAVAASASAVNRPIHVVTTVSPGPHFFGDPIRMMSALYFGYDKEPLKEHIRSFLHQDDATVAPTPVATGE